MRPGDAAAAVHSHSALTLRSRSSEHPARRLASGEVCPESTRHDGWLSRTFSCASLCGGHAARRLATERIPASRVPTVLLSRGWPIGRLLDRGASEQSLRRPMLARAVSMSDGRDDAAPQRLSLSLSLSLAGSLSASVGCSCQRHGRAWP